MAAHLAFPDHHRYGPGDAEAIGRRVRETGADLVVTTAKDHVRWPREAPTPAILRLELEVPAEDRVGALVLERIAAAPAAGNAG